MFLLCIYIFDHLIQLFNYLKYLFNLDTNQSPLIEIYPIHFYLYNTFLILYTQFYAKQEMYLII
jgi:hypothetical protein